MLIASFLRGEVASILYGPHKAFCSRYEVEPSSGEHVFLIGFNVGHCDRWEYWNISGHGGQYSTAEEALKVLEAEAA